ncbi:NADH dehydrogenase [ubiquinone] 1 alpha subcomplex subunit 10, mitochondrial isoform X2 [Zootermopsis nevadensis]|uniref:NADH dehydrogenase [ubiquinone] 1 alpha subcomplex subunit 10, mitochondrial isoform X2 n=1 Tax=Zootermopsis nevadensis TaxID=136037 RepID=UPI000B8E9BE7|nr:NADH dehydrogenase [ubiquinone] 1 alpha subcomplex subunit 10, mitochondrial isoform X2 [Zootermopsis nevadensis]
MAWISMRAGVCKILATPSGATAVSKPFLQINLKGVFPLQAACISGSVLRDKNKVRPAPFPYKTKRKLDPELPAAARSFDEKSFCIEPNHEFAASFQILKYQLRYSKYIDALAHLLNTGQGVVLERCVYSDFVFLETMHKAGYISKGAHSVYYDIYNNTIDELMKPHLVIYLDIPVPLVQQRIKDRNIPHEVNSKVFTSQYLSDMEYFYKQRYLKEIGTHSELLIYDWSSYGDVEVVIEDIERINFDKFNKYDTKMDDWKLPCEWDWNTARMLYTNDKDILMYSFLIPRFDVPELVLDAYDAHKFRKIWHNAPGMKYDKEFNPDMGDTNLLFKTKKIDHRSSS